MTGVPTRRDEAGTQRKAVETEMRMGHRGRQWRRRAKAVIFQSRREASEETRSAKHLDLGFLAP